MMTVTEREAPTYGAALMCARMTHDGPRFDGLYGGDEVAAQRGTIDEFAHIQIDLDIYQRTGEGWDRAQNCVGIRERFDQSLRYSFTRIWLQHQCFHPASTTGHR